MPSKRRGLITHPEALGKSAPAGDYTRTLSLFRLEVLASARFSPEKRAQADIPAHSDRDDNVYLRNGGKEAEKGEREEAGSGHAGFGPDGFDEVAAFQARSGVPHGDPGDGEDPGDTSQHGEPRDAVVRLQ